MEKMAFTLNVYKMICSKVCIIMPNEQYWSLLSVFISNKIVITALLKYRISIQPANLQYVGSTALVAIVA